MYKFDADSQQLLVNAFAQKRGRGEHHHLRACRVADVMCSNSFFWFRRNYFFVSFLISSITQLHFILVNNCQYFPKNIVIKKIIGFNINEISLIFIFDSVDVLSEIKYLNFIK